MKEYPKAIASYEELAKVRPGDTDTLFDLATLYENSANYEKARQYYLKVRELDPKRVDALLALGRVEIESGTSQNGLDYLSSALNLAIQFNQEEPRTDILQAMGVAYQDLNRLPEALRSFQDSLEIKQRLGLKNGAAESLSAIAQVQLALGKPDLALRGYNDALKLLRETGDKAGVADQAIGRVLAQVGRADESQKNLNDALAIATELKNQILIAQMKGFQGDAALYRGDYKSAHAFYQDARNAAVHTTDHQLDLVTKMNLARIAVEEGHPQTAIGTLQSVRDSANAGGMKYLALQCSISFSRALILSKKYPQAQAELQRALVAGEKLGTAELVADSHDLLARIADLTSNASESQHQHLEALTILDGIQKESHLDLRGRSDFTQILAAKR